MTSQTPAWRLGLDLIFTVFLINGLLICAAIVAALAARAGGGDQSGIGAFAFAMSAVVPSILAWLGSAILAFTGPRVADVRVGAALATAHLLLWAILIALGAFSSMSTPPDWLLAAPVIGTGCYGLAVTWLALRWFFARRRRLSAPVA